MTLADALQAYTRALSQRHLSRFLRLSVVNAANENGRVSVHSDSTTTKENRNNVPR